MTHTLSVKKIGVFAHVGNENLGDEVIFTAVIQNVKRYYPDAELYGFSVNPDDTQRRHRIAAFPIRRIDSGAHRSKQQAKETLTSQNELQSALAWEKIHTWLKTTPVVYPLLKAVHASLRLFLGFFKEASFCVRCICCVRKVDLLIVAGSGQLCDHFGGPWGFPYTLFRWSLMARVSGAKVAFVSVGAGPINSSVSRFFIKRALSLASYRSYRDQSSKNLIEELGVCGAGLVFPDLAYSLELSNICSKARNSQSLQTIGINPVPFFDDRYWHESNPATYEGYIIKLARFASWLLQEGYTVVLFPTQLRADPRVIEDIKRVIEKNGKSYAEKQLLTPAIFTIEDLLSQIAVLDLVVASRFHGIILSYLQKKPVLGIAYQQKTHDLMAQMGQAACVLNIDSFDLDPLIERFMFLELESETVKGEIERRILLHRQLLEKQYEQIFQLLNGELG